nr:hypothetical protein [uncultured bacterium]
MQSPFQSGIGIISMNLHPLFFNLQREPVLFQNLKYLRKISLVPWAIKCFYYYPYCF